MKALKRILLSLAMALLVVWAGAGCATTTEEENAAERPWNRPQGWEQGIPGMNLPPR